MLKKALLYKLHSYNIHIGHTECYNSALNYYILGKRFNFYIIDINKTFFLLKKVVYFLKTLALNNGSILFHYSKYMSLDLIYRCVLWTISKRSKQQLVTYHWRYGSIGNFFFSFYILVKDLTNSWNKEQSYLFNFEKENNIYSNLNIETEQLDVFEYLFSDEFSISYKNRKYYNYYTHWYKKWLLNKDAYSFLLSKERSLKKNKFLKQLCLNDFNNLFKKKKVLNFKNLFLKLFYYISLKKKNPFLEIDINIKNNTNLNYCFLNRKFISYWRFALYFKSFNSYYQIPDSLFSVFPDNNNLPLKEYTYSNLVSIGLIDTNSSINSVHYPIISNDDSFLIVVFYYTLFSNLFIENELNLYNLMNIK